MYLLCYLGPSAAPNSNGSTGGGVGSHYPFGHPSLRAYSSDESTTTQVKWVYRAVNFLTDLFFGVDKELDHLPEKRKSIQPTTKTGADMLTPVPSFLPPDISAGYGELSWHGFDKVFNYMHNECPPDYRIGSTSRFLDIGSGFGKCVLHAKLRGKVARSVGIECIKTRHEKALEALHLLRAGFVPGLSDAKDAPDFEGVRNLDLRGCELFEGDITQQRFHPLLRTASHIYAFDVVFSKDTHRKILPLISECNFSLFGTYLAPAKVAALGGTNMQMIHSVKVHTTGKQSFTCWFYVKTGAMAPSVMPKRGASADRKLDPETDEFYQAIRDQAPHTPEHVLHANALAAAAEAAAAARAKAATTVPAPRKSKHAAPARSDSSSSPDSPSPSPSPTPSAFGPNSHKKGAAAARRLAEQQQQSQSRSHKKKVPAAEPEPTPTKRSHKKKGSGSSGTKRKHVRKASAAESSDSGADSSSEHCSDSSESDENEDDLPLAQMTPAQVAAREARRLAREARKAERRAQRLARQETRRERVLAKATAADSKPKPLTKSQLFDLAISSAFAPKPAAARRTNNSTALKLEPLQVSKLPRELSHYLADAATAVVKAGQIQLEQGAELMVLEGTEAAEALAAQRRWGNAAPVAAAPTATAPGAVTSAETAASSSAASPTAAAAAPSNSSSNSKRKQQKTSHAGKK